MSYQMYQAYDAIMAIFKIVIGAWGLYSAYKIIAGKPKKDV